MTRYNGGDEYARKSNRGTHSEVRVRMNGKSEKRHRNIGPFGVFVHYPRKSGTGPVVETARSDFPSTHIPTHWKGLLR